MMPMSGLIIIIIIGTCRADMPMDGGKNTGMNTGKPVTKADTDIIGSMDTADKPVYFSQRTLSI